MFKGKLEFSFDLSLVLAIVAIVLGVITLLK